MVGELLVLCGSHGCLRSCSCGSGKLPLWPLSLFFSVAPTAPPVGSYDIGGQESNAGAVSFHKAARFKSDGSGTNIHRLPRLPAI